MTEMSTSFLQSRIPITAFRVVTIVTFVLALLAVICRLCALIPQRKRMGLDDVLLIFATVFLIVGTTIVLIGIGPLYFIESLELNGAGVIAAEGATNWLETLVFFQRTNWSYLVISWACIFFVKFSFLTFFSSLCSRLPRIELHRKITYAICIIAYIYCTINVFIPCPHLGLEATYCSYPDNLERSLNIGIVAIVLDVLTDVLILSIPITLLWKVKMRIYQKTTIGIFLCLSAVMIILAIVRAAGIHYYGYTDNPWEVFWQQVEASTAVTMISITAFRSVFNTNVSRNKPWQASVPNFVRKIRGSSITSQEFHLQSLSNPAENMTEAKTAVGSMEYTPSFTAQSSTDGVLYHEEEPVRLPGKALTP